MSRLASVVIRRFKRLQEIKIPVADVTLLVGANNAGKSSVLQAIHFAVSLAQSARLVGEGVSWRRDKFELSFNPAQLLYTPVADVLALASGGTLMEASESRIEVQLTTEGGESCTVGLRRGRNRNIAVQLEGRALGEELMDLEKPFSVYVPGLAGVPRSESYQSPGVVRRIVARGDANLVLRNVLLTLRHDDRKWSAFLDDMRGIFPDINVDVEFDEGTDEHIQAFFRLPGGPRLPVDAAGTSILQASQIFAYIGLFSPRVLVLDEPDSHLHPNNQRALCDLVCRLAAERDFKALISTHSRHVMDAMHERASVIWMSKGQIVENEDAGATAMLLDLGALDSADYFADASLRCVVATEDTDSLPLEALLWSNGFHEDDTEVASYAGSAKVDSALVLGGFLRDKAPNLCLIVHRDGDYMGEDARTTFEERLKKAGVKAFVTMASDIEGYFLNADHLAHLNPGLSRDKAMTLIADATSASRDGSVRAIVNQRTNAAFAAKRDLGASIDHGDIAVQAAQDYDLDPTQMRRGKIVLGALLQLVQKEIGANAKVYAVSPHLEVPALRKLAQAIWGAV